MKGFFSIIGLFLPHFFAATLSHRKATDKRLFKYFLPYGYMKRRMQYVFRANVGDEKRDCGIAGLFRWICPYGTILWWDGGRDVAQCSSLGTKCPSVGVDEMRSVHRQIESLRREVMDGSERLELLILRLMDSERMQMDAKGSF